ncbi:MAG: MjaI family restriction endonuclease [Candidatus Cloacimonadaceae bacterium]|nr:MjaI family restriction endonuclease [Candidatus Cloacimonadaceae bacterium]
MAVSTKIKNEELFRLLNASVPGFPKYTTQLMNLANQNAQGTRPSVVGKMSDLIQEFPGRNLREWEEWYLQSHPTAIEDAATRVYGMIEQFKRAIELITKDVVEEWIKDLVITKTFAGLKVQEAILQHVSEQEFTTYRIATAQEESQNIDGVIGDRFVSIKPTTWSGMLTSPISICVDMIYYEKTKDGLVISYDFK